MSIGSALVIVGAGGFGREVLQYAIDAGIPVRGFLDDRCDALTGTGLSVAVTGPIEGHVPAADVAYVVSLGDPGTRRRIAASLAAAGARFASVVHPRAWVAPTAVLGDGAIVAPGAVVGPHAVLDAHVALNVLASIGHDATVGEGSVFSPYATCNGDARIGAGVLLGTRATVLPGVHVGEGARIAAGAVCYREVPAWALAQGDPARARVMFASPIG
jgi:sugar O-acyltransferase (sialic acid O-acetyltransferase NeuD family)